MSAQNDFQAYLQDYSVQPKRFFTEEPLPLPPPIQKAPTGLAPMARIELEGKAYRGLASGSQPWWVIITGWVVVGVPCVSVLIMTASLFSLGGGAAILAMLGAIALCAVYLWIMYRGTKAKLTHQREQQQRKAKYRSEMNE